MKKTLSFAVITLISTVALAFQTGGHLPSWDRVEGKPISFYEDRGFEFRVDDSMRLHYEKPTVEISLIVPPQFSSERTTYEFYSVLYLSKELSAALGSHPHDGKQRALLTISEAMARKSQVVFYFTNETKAARKGTRYVLDLAQVLDRWEKSKKGSPNQ